MSQTLLSVLLSILSARHNAQRREDYKHLLSGVMSIGVMGHRARVMESSLPPSERVTVRVKHGSGDVNVGWDHKPDVEARDE
jgi:hypothetical protein